MIEIGNIHHTPQTKLLLIYDGKTNEKKATVCMPDDTLWHAELMGEHYFQFSFNYNRCVNFNRGDYMTYDGIRYMIRRDYQPTEVNLQHYKYVLKLEAPEMLFQDFICFLRLGAKEAEWTLTGTAQQFLEVALSNINDYLGESWSIGIVESTEVINIAFSSTYVFDMLTEVAEKFNCEWYVDYTTKTINLVGHYEHGEEETLRRDEQLIDITRSNENDKEFCTRLYPQGSTRNIPRNYREVEEGATIEAVVQKRLRLPIDKGDYIDAYPNMQGKEIVELVKVFDDIYPHRIGTITSLRVDNSKKTEDGKPFPIYYFKDDGLEFKKDYILPGQTLMLHFSDNSLLNGRDFELAYHEKTQEFEIINDQSIPDLVIPNELLKPNEGDRFVLYNFDIALVGDQYVGEAEEQLYNESRAWMDSQLEDNATYTCPVNPVHVANTGLDLAIGQRVRLESVLFKEGEKHSRVFTFDKYFATCRDVYTIGDKPKYSRLATIDKNVATNKKVADTQHSETTKDLRGVKKTVKGLDFISQALEQNTSIEGGLILLALLQLGIEDEDGFKGMAGLNGLLQDPKDVAFWIGGDIDQAVERKTPIGFLADGSGWLANNLISWDVVAQILALTVTGKYQTAKSGERIEIDPDMRAIQFIDEKERVIIAISFDKQDENITAQVKIDNFNENGRTGSMLITGTKISMMDAQNVEFFSVAKNEDNKTLFKIADVPIGRDNTESGALYVGENESLKLKQ